jgi:hypothetical protein
LVHRGLKPVFNFAVRIELCALGVKLAPRDEDPLFAPPFFLNISECSFLRVKEGWVFPLVYKVHPWGPREHAHILSAGLSMTGQSIQNIAIISHIVINRALYVHVRMK